MVATMFGIMIRKATTEDAPRLAEIHVFGWRAAYRGIVPEEYLFKTLSVARRAPRFAEAIAAGEETYVLADDAGGAEGILRGFMTIGDCRDDDVANGPEGGRAFELWGIYVDPLMKRAGVGRRLVEFCEGEARARGRSAIYLWVLRDNAPSRAFYEAMGFAPDGREQLIERLGAWETRYVKRLDP